ncbi:MAG: thiamine-phosphate kinase [Gemmatimonadetes bacterium]|nr:thiamine-phosphate kinase [Gemmatimonadota bacterium]
MRHVSLGPGREFDAIRALIAQWGETAQGLGDDAALLAVPSGAQLVVSVDASVEDVHFKREWLTPEEIGWRATTAAISDLAAMAADPLGLLVALSVPPRWQSDIMALGAGIAAAARAARMPIVGGDTTGGARLTLSVTVLGSVRAPLGRSGARPGDIIYVTGALGGPSAALQAFALGERPAEALRARFAHPEARLDAARWLAERGATAAIDISDGLAADLRHVAAASGVTLELDVRAVPVLAGATVDDALAGGEEYELAITSGALDTAAFEAATGVRLTAVGTVTAGPGVVRGSRDGRRVDLPGGHDHFSS